MSDVDITCTPRQGILRISADTIAALDALGQTLPDSTPWQVDVAVGWTAADTVHVTARPHTEETAA